MSHTNKKAKMNDVVLTGGRDASSFNDTSWVNVISALSHTSPVGEPNLPDVLNWLESCRATTLTKAT